MNEQEHGRLFEVAQARGVSVARLLVESALGVGLPAPAAAIPVQDREALEGMSADLKAVRGELGRLANNFNQLAHVANETGQAPSVSLLEGVMGEWHALAAQLVALSVRLSRFSRGFGDARGFVPEGEDEEDQGSAEWWGRRVDAHRVRYGLHPSSDEGEL